MRWEIKGRLWAAGGNQGHIMAKYLALWVDEKR